MAELATLREKDKTFRKKEKELLEREMSLKAKEEEIELEVKRQIVKERDKIVEEARELEIEKYEIERRERDERERQLMEKLKDMEAKLADGSRQMRGQLQEDWIEDLLKKLFPMDSVERIAKSRGGADILHTVRKADVQVGKIYWESKRTKDWDDKWLAKLREDQRKKNADMAVLVSITLPNDQPNGGLREAVLVIHPSQLEAIAPVLRQSLLNIYQEKVRGQHSDHKSQRLLEYFGGKEFNLLLSGIIEDIKKFRDLDEHEEQVITRILAQRRELRRKSTERIVSLYGTVREIMGTLPEVKGLELPAPPRRAIGRDSKE